MKPRNKRDRRILELSQSLPPLSTTEYREAFLKVVPHIAKYSSKKEYTCLDCGHTWSGQEREEVVCPHCSATLKVDKSRKWNFYGKYYFSTVTTCCEYQVLRIYFLEYRLRRGKPASCWVNEAFQRWISEDGNSVIVGRARNSFPSPYCDNWAWGSDMEIRTESMGHSVVPYDVVGLVPVIPALRRNGFNGDFHDCPPYSLIRGLLTDNKIETLWKIKRYTLTYYALTQPYLFNQYWSSIKVAIRHKYRITDPSMWMDLVQVLGRMGKDILNPRYICPKNLKKEHDYWVIKQNAYWEREQRRRERERQLTEEQRYLKNLKSVAKDEAAYRKAKQKFFDLKFTDGELVVKPLQSVREFVEEGHTMHHCVFANKYFQKSDALILHALVDNATVATIEISLSSLSIIQCRGPHNQKPAMYDRIISLIKKNAQQIASKIA